MIVVRPKDPFEIAISFVMLISGIAQVIGSATPSSVSLLLPPIVRYIWLFMATVGALGVLVGTFWREPVTGIFIERIGLTAAGWGLVIYGVAVSWASWPASIIAGPLTLILGLAFFWKAHQLSVRIKELL